MHATNTTQTQQVHFLTCFDQKGIAYSDDWVAGGDMPPPNTSALQCANQTGIDSKAVSVCFNGTKGDELMLEALHYFTETFPMYATGARFDVPHVYINNNEQNIDLPGNVWTYVKTLCDLGSGGDVCSALPSNASESSGATSKAGLLARMSV